MSQPADTAITVRPSSTSIFAFDSDDRYKSYVERRIAPSYPFDVVIQKAEALVTGFFKRIGLTEFRLNWSLPNISKAWGNNQINVVYIGLSTVTAASGSGTVQTYTAANNFVVGQSVNVLGLSPAGYNVLNATILSATSTNFTVAGTTTGASTGTGNARVSNNAIITAATATTAGTGANAVATITYTAANTYSAGQIVRVVAGLSPAGFNFSNARIVSATPTQFVVNLPPGTTLTGSSTGTGTAVVGLTRQVTLDDGFYSATNVAFWIANGLAPVMPGFVGFPLQTDENIISFQAPEYSAASSQYEFYFEPVRVPIVYAGGNITAAVGSAGTVTYTVSGSNLSVGQLVTVTGLRTTAGASLNLTGLVDSVSGSQFTILDATVGTAANPQAGTATVNATSTYPNISLSSRQLFDMLNLAYASAYRSVVNTGALNLRATDYIDVVCSQLTQNQGLRDSSSLPNTRDILSRIYLDEPVPSQSPIMTRTVGLLTPTSITLTGLSQQTAEVAIFTTTTAITTAIIGARVSISGIAGVEAVGWNSTGTITNADVVSPYAFTVTYDEVPTGTPTFGGSPVALAYVSTPTESRPITTWDDRMNGVTPFVIYRQFANPKEIRWSGAQPLGNCQFQLYDDQGRSIQDLWSKAYPIISGGVVNSLATRYANGFVWNLTCLLSEN